MFKMLARLRNSFFRRSRDDQAIVEEALGRALGPMEDMVGHAARPLSLGGFADVAWFRTGQRLGLVCATTELCICDGQKPNAGGRYELAIATASHDEVASNLISRLGRYTLDAAIEDGDTMDIAGIQPNGSGLTALLFVEFTRLDLPGAPAAVMMAVGLWPSELAAWRKGRKRELIDALRVAGVHLRTDWMRPAVI